tara:strand:- start:498 stop:611 length:114 start_codon:yes stop_codon:yes gene_type:complete
VAIRKAQYEIETKYEVLLGFSESAENKTLFADMTGFG